MAVIERYCEPYTVSVTTSASTSEGIPFGNMAGGEVYVPTGSTITTLTWHVAADRDPADGTFLPAYDKDGNAVTQTVAQTRAYPLPEALFGAGSIKAVGDAAGSVTVTTKG